MKLNNNFLTYETKNKNYMVSTSHSKFNGMVKGNSTASFIINCLKKETTIDEIIDKVMYNFNGVTREEVEKDVNEIILKLKEIDALDE